jgi:Cu(I)/Ag(I) efflux system membrane fusion protein
LKKSTLLIIGGVVLLIGVVIGRYTLKDNSPEKKPMYWIDSMEPQIHYPGPGKSRMGMELTPVYPEESMVNDTSGTLRISPTVVNNLGVRTAVVSKGTLSRDIETVGYVEPNENKISHIHTYAEGWVHKLVVKAEGEPIKKGQLLLQIYSPQLVGAQEEFLIALQSKNKPLIDASYKRLRALNISESQIVKISQSLKSDRLVDVYAPRDGIISMLSIREGMYVMPQTEIMNLVDLSNVWLIAQVFEDQAAWVKVGDVLEARLPAYPGKVLKGEVEYVYPQVDPVTRTLKARFRFNNPEGLLRPNMYANIKLFGKSKPNVITIPIEALIRTSKGDRVVVSTEEGHFDVRPVTIGIESNGQVEVLSGLKTGEKVVISGQFLIDSESNLKSSFERLETQKGEQNDSQK